MDLMINGDSFLTFLPNLKYIEREMFPKTFKIDPTKEVSNILPYI